MPKMFTNAGISTDSQGYLNYRMAMDIDSRTKTLEYNGHTDIQFWKLPRPMLRPAAITWLNGRGVNIGEEELQTVTAVRGRKAAAKAPVLTAAQQRRFDAAQAELDAAEAMAEKARGKLERIAA